MQLARRRDSYECPRSTRQYGAAVAPMAICTRFVHQAIARFALACEGRVSVDAIHIVVAVVL